MTYARYSKTKAIFEISGLELEKKEGLSLKIREKKFAKKNAKK